MCRRLAALCENQDSEECAAWLLCEKFLLPHKSLERERSPLQSIAPRQPFSHKSLSASHGKIAFLCGFLVHLAQNLDFRSAAGKLSHAPSHSSSA
jgi:hypothetical protein